jgi:hypothetical protein
VGAEPDHAAAGRERRGPRIGGPSRPVTVRISVRLVHEELIISGFNTIAPEELPVKQASA